MTQRQIREREIAAMAAVDQFNKAYPVGTRCRYWSGVREGPGVEGVTGAAAQVLCGTAVVWIAGHAACVALSHVEPVRLCEKCKAELESAGAIVHRLGIGQGGAR